MSNRAILPSVRKLQKKGDSKIFEVPITVGNTFYEYIPNSLLETIPKYSKLWAFPREILKEWFSPIILGPTLKRGTFKLLKTLTAKKVKENNINDVFLVMMFHNVEFFKNINEKNAMTSNENIYFERMRKYFEFIQDIGFISLTHIEVAEKKSGSNG